MASKNNNSQAHPTSEDKVNKILETLQELNKQICDKSTEHQGIAEGDNRVTTIPRSMSAPRPPSAHVSFDGKLIKRLHHQSQLLKLKLRKLEQFQTNVGMELDKHLVDLQSLDTNLDSTKIMDDLEDIEKKISDLLYQVPLLSSKSEKPRATTYGEDEVHQNKAYGYLPGIHTFVEELIKCEAFREVKRKFMELEIEKKICLLSFAVFPENRAVYRTVLMYWWIGEGIIPVDGAEEAVREVLKEFTEKNLVEPVEERRKVAPSSYKMSPFVHSSVIHLSEEIGLFDIYGGKDNKPRTSKSKMGKVCLVEAQSMEALDIETVFNVSERCVDYAVKWFLKNPHTYRSVTFDLLGAWFKSLKVFYLGRWERSQKRRIQVQNHELMKCLKRMTKVKVLSFQGISGIRTLNGSVCKLRQLIVLDLRECCDLTKLPDRIDSLENLVYLDMTGCYMLEYIPSRLSLLNNLEVLKGFVVSDAINESVACKLSYLKNLAKLKKLSIEINRGDLGVEQLKEYLVGIKVLTSLKVTWRRDLESFGRTPTDSTAKNLMRTVTRLGPPVQGDRGCRDVTPLRLEKLSLQRFPDEELPSWLRPKELPCLQKLHIGGGRKLKGLCKMADEKEREFEVKVLRLRSLPKLRIGWIELKQVYFPKLIFLEKFECPRVSLTPCDENGIWRADED